MTQDIRPLGASDGRTAYYVKAYGGLFGAGYLRLVVIDEFGNVEETPISAPYDEAAMTEDEAVVHHLKQNGVVARADADLERRRKDKPKEKPAEPPPDPPTERFYEDGDEIEFEAFEHARRKL